MQNGARPFPTSYKNLIRRERSACAREAEYGDLPWPFLGIAVADRQGTITGTICSAQKLLGRFFCLRCNTFNYG